MEDFIEFSSEQLDDKEFDNLKKAFVFNDIKNSLFYKKEGDTYITPSYYSLDEFKENLKDTDDFFPFLTRYYFNAGSGKREYPNLNINDEILLFFYEELDNFAKGTLKDYFLLELNLRNVSLALSLRKNGLPLTNKIMPYGDYCEPILKNSSPDFGLSGDFPFIDKLVLSFEKGDILETEKVIDNIKWNELDEICEKNNVFSFDFVLSYAIKLMSIERWLKLDKPHGEAMLAKLIEKIKGAIKFPNEFLMIGGKK
jgi:hypothetical protein